MTQEFEIIAETRSTLGSRASRRLRRIKNHVPVIMYGRNSPPLFLSVDHNHLLRSLENEAFHSHILTIHVEGQTYSAVVKQIQYHPFKPRVLHLDFLRVFENEAITASVPLHFLGEEQAPGIKQNGGVVSHLLSHVEIRCLPRDLPEYLIVDLSQAKLDTTIHLSHLTTPTGIEILALAHGDDRAIASIHRPRTTDSESGVETPTPEETV